MGLEEKSMNKPRIYFLEWSTLLQVIAIFIGLSFLNPAILGAKENITMQPKPEGHLGNIRQLTFGGKNAEAYFSFDGSQLIYQSTKQMDGKTYSPCYQIYVMDLDGSHRHQISNGMGGTTCGYFFPGGRRVLFSSTHLVAPQCPPEPKKTGRYRWALHDYDIFSFRIDGQQPQRLTATSGYDAEATVSPNGKTIVFTSIRDGDLNLYTMKIDGTNLKRLTHQVGYEGGAFFSPDSKRIVYRASYPRTEEEREAYQTLLAQKLVEPSNLEIFVMNADGSDKKQVTKNGASNFAPYFHPDGRRIIFSSNFSEKSGGQGRPSFHLFLVNDQGSKLEQITTQGHFNSFPMFSPDGSKLVWVSNRNAAGPREFNIFLADWVP